MVLSMLFDGFIVCLCSVIWIRDYEDDDSGDDGNGDPDAGIFRDSDERCMDEI